MTPEVGVLGPIGRDRDADDAVVVRVLEDVRQLGPAVRAHGDQHGLAVLAGKVQCGRELHPIERSVRPMSIVDDALAIATEAAELTLRWFRAVDLEVERRVDGTPVTAADRAAEQLVRERVREAYPDDGVLGEEQAEHLGTSGRRWIVDPIDGTKAFARGVPLYTTLLAVEDETGPLAGVIVVPALSERVWAERGAGCFHDGRPCRVSAVSSVEDAYLTTSSYSHWPEDALVAVRRSGAAMRTWGDGYGYLLVATGRMDAMVDPVVEPYDVAAMPVIISEAGGRFTDTSGAVRYDGGSGVATNGLLHDEVLSLLG
jgi:histidinol-phosphatase